MEWIIGGILVVFSGLSTASFWIAIVSRLDARRARDVLETYPAVDTDAIDRQFALLRQDLEDQGMRIQEEVANSERRENRIRGTVTRARQELSQIGVEHPGLEAEAAQLHLLDGGGGEGSGMHGVPPGVGGGESSSIPGVSVEQLQKARRMRV